MKILTYLYSLNELNNMGDIIVLNLNNYSFKYEKTFSIDEILDIKSKTNKEIYVCLNPLYSTYELDSIKDSIYKLKDIDGFIISDIGLYSILKEYNLESKIIYAPETFITNSKDESFYDFNKYMLSRELDLDSIKKILDKSSKEYLIKGFGYQMLSYSKRKHIKNYLDNKGLNINLDEFNITIKEETRDEHYRIIEDNHGTRIYKDKIFNIINYLKDINKASYLLLDRIFINDEMYFDTINLFKGLIDKKEYFSKYNNFENGYLESIVGLFKEDSK